MLILQPFHVVLVTLAMIVIPRSCSRARESMVPDSTFPPWHWAMSLSTCIHFDHRLAQRNDCHDRFESYARRVQGM
jgi:hypothetical protein